MGKGKYVVVLVMLAGALLMGGCSRQSIEDVRRFEETSTAVENQTNQTGIIQENESRENKVDNVFAGMVSSSPKYAERYSDVDMEIYTGKLVTKFTYSIGETAIAENVDELSKLMSGEDIAEYIKYDTETSEKFSAYDKMINEDGTFANDRKGMKQVALLMELKITNNGDEDFQFLSNGFRLYCFRYNKQDDATYYSTIESRQSYLNIHDEHEIFRHHLTIKPGETKEVVQALRVCKENEAKVIAITSFEGSSITKYSDINLMVYNPKFIDKNRFINSQFSVMYVLDLISMVLLKDENLREKMQITIDAIIKE